MNDGTIAVTKQDPQDAYMLHIRHKPKESRGKPQ